MKFKMPLIAVSDMAVSRKFYEDVMNQKVVLDFGENITFEGDFSLQTKSSWSRFIQRDEKDILSKPDNFELYFEERAFDEFAERLKSLEVEYLHGVVEYPWGQRAVRFYDPDLHIIEVGESMEAVIRRFIGQGLSVEETSVRTQHPAEYIKRVLENELG
jgi:catechol 2,3-dioxygenase-like lactoylglutathione lyase family enzyme